MNVKTMYKDREVEINLEQLAYMLLTKETIQEMVEMLDPEQIGNVIISLYNTIKNETYSEVNLKSKAEKGILHRMVSEVARLSAGRYTRMQNLKQFNAQELEQELLTVQEPIVVQEPVIEPEPEYVHPVEQDVYVEQKQPVMVVKNNRWSVNEKGYIKISSSERPADISDIFHTVSDFVMKGAKYKEQCASKEGFPEKYREYAIDTVSEAFGTITKDAIAESFDAACNKSFEM